MNDSNSQNNRKNRIASIISLAVGITGLALIVLFFSKEEIFTLYVNKIFPYALFIFGAVLIVGIIFGKEGEKSNLEGVAIVGKGICIICLIIWFLFTGWLILALFWR